MVYLKPLYSRLDRLAQCQSSPFSTEAQQEHLKVSFFQNVIYFYQKISGLKILILCNTLTSVYTKEAVVVISEYCLLIFKVCRTGHPDFEIRFIGFFASNVIKTAFIIQECIWSVFIDYFETHLIKNCVISYSILFSHWRGMRCIFLYVNL